jgi:hypothetical protein
MDSGILMIQDSILVCSPDPRILQTAQNGNQGQAFFYLKDIEHMNRILEKYWQKQRSSAAGASYIVTPFLFLHRMNDRMLLA